jgi:hypothetical protein
VRYQRRSLLIIVGLVVFSLACRPLVSQLQPTAEPTAVPVQPTAEVVEVVATSVPATVEATTPPMPTRVSASPTATPRPKGSGLEIINDTDQDIWYLYLSPTDHNEWGEDRLGGTSYPLANPLS